MRTIRVEVSAPVPDPNAGPLGALIGSQMRFAVSTEVIVADDGDAGDAGREARRVIDAFIDGYASGDDA